MSIRVLSQASTTMNQLQQKMDVIGNNMSNVGTHGYKSRQAEFSSLLFQQIDNLTHPENGVNRLTPDGIRVGTGARLGAINQNNALGTIQTTDRDLDVALTQENHFFEIDAPDDPDNDVQFTRDGAFYLQPTADETEMELVNKNGNYVMGDDGNPIRFTSDGIESIQVADDGTVTVRRGNQDENVGRLSIVTVDNPRILETVGENNFRLPNVEASGVVYADIVAAANYNESLLKSGALEMSNVDIADQMTDLINAQRAYQFNARSVTTADEMQGLINQLRT